MCFVRFFVRSFLALTLTLTLTGCGNKRQEPFPSDLFGPSTATGTIMGTGASLYRRGTHVLLVEDRPLFFLESSTVDLHEYEGTRAVIEGEISPNTHPLFLPVFRVAKVIPQGPASEKVLQTYDVPPLKLSLEAPALWRSELSPHRLAFRLTEDGMAFVTIEKSGEKALPEGFPLRVGGRNGVRASGGREDPHRIFVEADPDTVVLFTFTPMEEDVGLRDRFYALLQTVRFAAEGSSSMSSASSAELFIPCGGPAHVLCPEGMFCEVRELKTGIGACKALIP